MRQGERMADFEALVARARGLRHELHRHPELMYQEERTAQVVRAAQDAGYGTVVSARSGDTEDAWLADLAVGWRAGQIKVGSTTRSERTAKWNRLLEIEAELGGSARFAGRDALARTGTGTATGGGTGGDALAQPGAGR